MIDWDRIESFVGFGRSDAPVVFIGMEEGLRRDADLKADLLARSTYERYMDLAEAQAQLDGPGSYFGRTPITQKTWRPMCHVMLRRSGIPNPTLAQRLRYQADHLGRRNGESLLVELLPYPHSDSGQWLYEEFGRYGTREAYTDALTPRRQALLRQIFSDHPRELIIAYGKTNWPVYKAIFDGVIWHAEGPFEFGEWGKTRVALVHAFSSKEFNTDEQLNRFADIPLGGAIVAQTDIGHAGETAKNLSSGNISSTEQARRRANRGFRDTFGAFALAYREANGVSPQAASDKAYEFAGQANVGGVLDLERGRGWVNPKFAEGVFRAVGIPDAELLGRAYADLKKLLGGVTKEIG